ncbi:uncharacterized protein LOC111192886 [Astyanax mexicanus]|uniref:uncharacterized protein LOC111192886 n=1 Tax=Astyanax mexicanus TaxID=7994 RepID=UPI0020CA9F1F|nr:uncharacterized protein LOC111192886 [Astyanax mexicanus]
MVTVVDRAVLLCHNAATFDVRRHGTTSDVTAALRINTLDRAESVPHARSLSVVMESFNGAVPLKRMSLRTDYELLEERCRSLEQAGALIEDVLRDIAELTRRPYRSEDCGGHEREFREIEEQIEELRLIFKRLRKDRYREISEMKARMERVEMEMRDLKFRMDIQETTSEMQSDEEMAEISDTSGASFLTPGGVLVGSVVLGCMLAPVLCLGFSSLANIFS